MAEDLIRKVPDRAGQYDTVITLVLQSVTEEWESSWENYDDLGHLMRKCFTKAGLQLVGEVALRIHTQIFAKIFIGSWVSTVPLEADSTCIFTAKDYFQMIMDDELGWLSFLTMMLQHIRIQKASGFLDKMVEFVAGRIKETRANLMDLKLVICGLKLAHSITLDFFQASLLEEEEGTKRENECSDLSASETTPRTHREMYALCQSTKNCLELALQLCQSCEYEHTLLQDTGTFKQLVETLTLFIIILNRHTDIKDLSCELQRLYVGKISIPEVDEIEKKKKNVRRNETWTQHCNLDDEFVMTQICKNSVDKKETAKESLQYTGEDEEVTDDHKQSSRTSMNSFKTLIHKLRTSVSIDTYKGIIHFFCRGDFKSNESFYVPLTDIFVDAKTVSIGFHRLSAVQTFPKFIQLLLTIVTDSVSVSEDVKTSVDLTGFGKGKGFLFPEEFQDLRRLKMTEVDHLLESGRDMAGKNDLELLQKAVSNQEKGWRDLLTLGLRTTDIDGWWNAGFYDLVWQYESVLSTEANVRQVLRVLQKACTSAVTELHGDQSVKKLSQLFGVMFRRLPIFLQEQVVLASLAVSTHSDNMQTENSDTKVWDNTGVWTDKKHWEAGGRLDVILGGRSIADELTPVLNKLTSANVNKLMSHILHLCLYDVNTVIQQALQVALGGKGQVQPIVQVLRQMPQLCGHHDNQGKQTHLIGGLCEVLPASEITDNKIKNVVQLFSLLTENYQLVVDESLQLSEEKSALLSIPDVFTFFLLPALERVDETDINTAEGHPHSNLTAPSENRAGQEVSGEKDDQTKSLKTCTNVSHGAVDSKYVGEIPEVPVHVALDILHALIAKMEDTHITKMKLFPLLVLLADVLERNYAIFVDGELDKRRLAVRVGCQRTIDLICDVVISHSKFFSEREFLWLKKQAVTRGWLYTAVLAPVLHAVGNLQLQDVLINLTRQMTSISCDGKDVKVLTLLLQLGLVNDVMCREVTQVVTLTSITASTRSFHLVLGHLLMMSTVPEMNRLVDVVMLLLGNQERFLTMDESQTGSDDVSPSKEGRLCVEASQCLTDSFLQLTDWHMKDASLCHVTSNYQTAVQCLLPKDTRDLHVLTSVLTHHCCLLAYTSGEAAQILQVSATNILIKLKSAVSSEKKNGKEKVEVKVREDREKNKQWVLGVRDHLACVTDEGVKTALFSQLTKMF